MESFRIRRVLSHAASSTADDIFKLVKTYWYGEREELKVE